MKLDVDHKEICNIDLNIINNILNNIVEEDWFVDDYRKSVDGMGDTANIPIFHSKKCGSSPKALWSVEKRPLFNKYYPLIFPILELFKNYYDYNFHTSFLTRLNPGGTVEIHPDKGEFLERCHRIHIPIQTNNNVFYCIEEKEYNWKKGKSYEFDNTRLHGVFNRSMEYRIHLILNLYKLNDCELKRLISKD